MHTIIFKNDAVGDLIHSLNAINNIVQNNKDEKIIIFLSKLNARFSFLVKKPNVEIKVLNYHLNLLEKIKIFLFLITKKINSIYILSPKGFYFYLPIIFRNIKFFAICVDDLNKKKRPAQFLRKYLFKYVVNNREKIFKRKSSRLIQEELTGASKNNINFNLKINSNKNLIKNLPSGYIYFHYKKKICDELGWGLSELKILFNELANYYDNIVFTRDISGWAQSRGEKNKADKNISFDETFNLYDLKSNKFINNNSNVLIIDNVFGEDLFSVINNSEKVICFH